jgi:hypothetical protein
MATRIAEYNVADFLGWQQQGELELAPRFQRRVGWPERARSYFIDTVLRGLPCPPIFLRMTTDAETMRSIREVVDGQQRLSTVFAFAAGEITVSRVHNEVYGGLRYDELPLDARSAFLSYGFVVEVLEDVSDAEVLDLFARFNTNTMGLNAQELRNARYFGRFKQLAYELALDHYAFWQAFRVFSDQQIARMKEAEFVSELLLTMLDGIRSTRSKDLDAVYTRYEDDFPQREELREQFKTVMDTVGETFADEEVWKVFRRRAALFSLFVAVFDARFGLPGSKRPRIQFKARTMEAFREALAEFSAEAQHPSTPAGFDFQEAARTSITDPVRRRRRHDLLWDEVLMRLI